MEKHTYQMHLILNTHWDREYRWSFRETQIRLLEAVDLLIDTMEKDPRFAYFHTDSQASFLDDYLELRPENRDRVKRLVADGRIQTGPWYTLPAEFLVSGEALVRNLLLGHHLARQLGGVMKVAYNIFSWGQVSQLPQIYRQFGMDTILFYRGIDQSHLDKLEFHWRAPDGTQALGITFSSYHRLNFWVYVYVPYIKGRIGLDINNMGDGFFVHGCDANHRSLNQQVLRQPNRADIEAAMEGMGELISTLVNKTSTDHLLLLQGFDQENPDPVIPDLVEEINQRMDDGRISISSLPEYVEKVRHTLSEKKLQETLFEMEGEMLHVERSGDPFAPLYNGVFSARMPLKQLNSDSQYRLEKWAEPAAIWAHLAGKPYPKSLLDLAWKSVLQNQQHDGIGGCHVDRVTRSMEERYANSKEIAEAVVRDSLYHLTAQIDFSGLDQQQIGLTVFNSTQYRRTEIVGVSVDVPVSWGLRRVAGTKYVRGLSVEVHDSDGKPVASQVLSLEDEDVYAYFQYGSATTYEVTRVHLALEVRDVPPMGYRCYQVTPVDYVHRPVESLTPSLGVLENEHILAEIGKDGSIRLEDKTTRKVFEGLHVFEDSGDCGGPLAFIEPAQNRVYTTRGIAANVALVTNGPLLCRYRVEIDWPLPASLEMQRKIHVPHGHQWVEHGPLQRSAEQKNLKICSEVTLTKTSQVLHFRTTIDHSIEDHRLRVLFPSGYSQVGQCHVDSPFDVVSRDIAIPDSSGWYESAARTLPTQSFVDVHDDSSGLCVLHRGLSEYEVIDRPQREIALTLLRCFSTAGNPTETYEPQPLAQCPGVHTFEYAVYPHRGSWRRAEVPRFSMLFNAPLRAVECTPHRGGNWGWEHSFLDVQSDTYCVTACTLSQDGQWVLLRGYNYDTQATTVRISPPRPLQKAVEMTLEEVVIRTIDIAKDNIIELTVGPKAITTIGLQFVGWDNPGNRNIIR